MLFAEISRISVSSARVKARPTGLCGLQSRKRRVRGSIAAASPGMFSA
jgi:hypothetical protein